MIYEHLKTMEVIMTCKMKNKYLRFCIISRSDIKLKQMVSLTVLTPRYKSSHLGFYPRKLTFRRRSGGFNQVIRGLLMEINLQPLFTCHKNGCAKIPAEQCWLSSCVIVGNRKASELSESVWSLIGILT